ncbi:MAG: hypothetical protein AAFQ80_22410 [Cyanobacteria bacterium J06621_8]
MDKYRLSIKLFGSTLGCFAALSGLNNPLLAQETAINNIQSPANSVSTSALDLISNHQLAQVIGDMDKFCMNFPFNSRCEGFSQPSTEVETQPSTTGGSTSRRSDSFKSGWAIVADASTLGLGGSIVRRISPQLNARAGVNAFGFGFDLEETDTTYDADLNLFNVSTLLDYHPFKSSGFRLSGGLIFSDNNIEGTATPNLDDSLGEATIEIGDETFNVDELASVDADLEITNSVAPYLGIGWGNPVSGDKGLGFFANLGVVFGSSVEVDITPNVADGVPAQVQEEIDAAVEQETEDLEDELGFLNTIYPVGSLGLSYQF